MTFVTPRRLQASCRDTPTGAEWLSRLPHVVSELRDRWALAIGPPFDHDEISCAWLAPATRADGAAAVIKVGLPHFEAEHEIAGLRFWDGDQTVRVLEADEALHALLLERCEPGTHLRSLRSEFEQDAVLAALLPRLWRRPPATLPFRPLSTMIARWTAETLAQRTRWPDAALVEEGVHLLGELSRQPADPVLLATDLHAGNVLSAQRQEWLVIDPKPFTGDPAFDATQHLLNCAERVIRSPVETVNRFAFLLGVDAHRVRLWLFARAAAQPRDDWGPTQLALARAIAP